VTGASALSLNDNPARWRRHGAVAALGLALVACGSTPLVPFSTETGPLILVPAAHAGVQDQRGRFREIYCAVLAARAGEVPDLRPCDDALTRLGFGARGDRSTGAARRVEPAPACRDRSGNRLLLLRPLAAAAAHRCRARAQVRLRAEPGLGRCAVGNHRQRAPDPRLGDGDGAAPGPPRLVLIGYSKGTPDVLEAIVSHPEIRARVAAVVSIAGAVGGSPLANTAEQYQADLLRNFPGAACDSGDGGGVASLRPAVRRAWLAQHPLPAGVAMYSVATLPQPERISSILNGSYRKLAMIDARNDSQMIFYDQLIPGRRCSATSTPTTGPSSCRSRAPTRRSGRCS
jgi:hypothetical protein